ncbi:hypothetical protein [Nocardia arizonensis]|nr:hypothetical protein [Nocardia arizonensis]
MSFAHRFDAAEFDVLIERLGAEVAERIARDRPTLCDILLAAFTLDRDPLALFEPDAR